MNNRLYCFCSNRFTAYNEISQKAKEVIKMKNTITTLRELAAIIYGENGYSITTKYKKNKQGMITANSKTIYSLDNKHFMSIGELCNKLRNVCESTGRTHQHFN